MEIRKLNIKFVSNRRYELDHISYEKIGLEEVDWDKVNTLDLETTGLKFNRNHVLLLVVGGREVQYVIDYQFIDHKVLVEKIKTLKLFLGHNLSFDLPFLIHRGFEFNMDTVYDTMEVERTLVKGTRNSTSLKNTIKRRLGLNVLDKDITMEFTKMSGVNPFFEDRHIKYAGEDILYLEDIKEVQMVYIRKLKQEKLVETNNNMVVVVSYMKVDGITLDKEKWMKTYYANLKKIDSLELQMDAELEKLGLKQKNKRKKQRTVQLDLLGGEVDVENKNLENINYASSDQIKDIFRYFKQPIPKINKKVKGVTEEKDTTGKDELAEYILNKPKSILIPFLRLLLEYKVLKKQVSTYGRKFLEQHLAEDGKVHPSYKVNSTATGRLSSADPNAQNIPRLDEFRSCFVGQYDNLLWTCDLGSAELRILASLAGDETMKRLYREGEDLHSYLATPVWRYLNNDPDAIVSKKTHPDFRNSMKTINFGIAYGASGSKVAKVLKISKDKGEKVLERMKEIIPQAFEYLENQKLTGQTVGKVKFEDKWNQIRYFEEVLKGEKLSKEREAGIGRESMNVALQGINAQMVKLAMVNIFKYIRANQLKSKLVLSVHDELVIEFPPEEEAHTEVFEALMVDASNYFLDGVEMEVEKNIGKVWNK